MSVCLFVCLYWFYFLCSHSFPFCLPDGGLKAALRLFSRVVSFTKIASLFSTFVFLNPLNALIKTQLKRRSFCSSTGISDMYSSVLRYFRHVQFCTAVFQTCTVLYCGISDMYSSVLRYFRHVQFCTVVFQTCTVLYCGISDMYSSVLRYVRHVQFCTPVCQTCTVLYSGMSDMYSSVLRYVTHVQFCTAVFQTCTAL